MLEGFSLDLKKKKEAPLVYSVSVKISCVSTAEATSTVVTDAFGLSISTNDTSDILNLSEMFHQV